MVGTHSKMNLRHQLLGLVLVAVFPILLFACSLIVFLAYQQKESAEQNLKSTTRALAFAVDEQIVSIVSSLKMLGLVEDFDKSNIPDLDRRLRRYVKSQPGWISISVAYPDGTQVLNTYYRVLTDKHNWAGQPFFKKILETGRPVISGFRITRVSGLKAISVGVPFKKNGVIEYILVASIYADSLSKLLQEQNLPKDWTAAILDEDTFVIARSRSHDKFTGRRATTKLGSLVRLYPEKIFEDANLEGEKTYGAFSRSRSTNWTIVLGMPVASTQMQPWNILWMVISGGSLLLTISLILATYYGRRISRPIAQLAQAAKLLGRGELISPVHSSVKEISEVSDSMVEASLERNRSEGIMKELYEKTKQAVELRDTFLSVASHELKTPLTTLKLQFQMLERQVAKSEPIDPKTLQVPFGRVLGQVRRLTLLVDDLLDVSRIAANKMELHFERVDLNILLQEIIQQFETEAQAARSVITLDMPEVLSGIYDRGRLEQIFTNLVSNAIKYGDGKPILVSVKRRENRLEISVKDNGIGIASEDQERIFKRFERAIGERSISGLGLGLWIVQKIVERLGGSVSVESTPGMGSTFTVLLPLG